MLTTGAMVRIGKTYGNLMVDLRATNEKLTMRSCRIVAELTGVPPLEARRLLDRCGGEVKTAIVSHLRGVTAQQARQQLSECDGHLRRALQRDDA
jgi:N-acetylmuramic acid 6-phosphate etherase